MNLLPSPIEASGGVFQLDREPGRVLSQSLAGSWSASARTGQRDLVVSGPAGVTDYEDALENAVGAAQEALDLIAVQGGPALKIEGGETSHIVWWTDGKIILRDVAIEDFKVHISATTGVEDGPGNPISPAVPALPWHESFRYFRISQTTGDLFDAYRNLYLAVEALLSYIVPMHLNASNAPAEGEGAWVRRALTQLHPVTVDLRHYATPGAANPVDAVFNDLYAGTRTRIFHSKAGRPILLPHTTTDRTGVLESLERIGRLYIDLARSALSLPRGIGVMTNAGFVMSTNFLGQLVLSDDPARAHDSDTVVNSTGGATVPIPTGPPDASHPGITTWAGEASVPDVLSNIPVIRRVGLTTPGGLFIVGHHDPALNIDDVAILQIQRSVQLVNRNTVRFRYVT